MGRPHLITFSFATTFLIVGIVFAYPVGMPFNLEQLNRQADVILKVRVVDTVPVEDEWFEATHGYKVVATEMKVISAVKGKTEQDTIHFPIRLKDIILSFFFLLLTVLILLSPHLLKQITL